MIQHCLSSASEAVPKLRSLSEFIHSHPETGYQEHQASRAFADFLSEDGFEVSHPAFGLETAVSGVFAASEEAAGSPLVCVLGEYDALPKMGHACGHNLIAVAALAAAHAAKSTALKLRIPLNLRVMGCPAEELFGGKIRLLDNGAFDGIAVALLAHGDGFTQTDPGNLGVARASITFHGKASHAAKAPEQGINALDAMVLFYSDIMKWRATLSPTERVHGIITNGGDAPNIVPDTTEALFYVRALSGDALPRLQALLENSARRSAEQVGCTVEVKWLSAYQPMKVNPALNHRFADYYESLGLPVIRNRGTEGRASTDMGDVSQRLPGTQFRFSVSGEKPCPLHSIAFREAAATETAFHSAVQCGAVMAQILLDFTTDAKFREQVVADFHADSGTAWNLHP